MKTNLQDLFGVDLEFCRTTRVDDRYDEIAVLLNVILPNPAWHPFFISDETTLDDCCMVEYRPVQARLTEYFGGHLPLPVYSRIWEFCDAARAMFPDWPERDPSGPILGSDRLARHTLGGSSTIEVDRWRYEIAILLNAFLPNRTWQPAFIHDDLRLDACCTLEPAMIQARLEGYFGCRLPVPMSSTLWEVCDAMQELFPDWPGLDPSQWYYMTEKEGASKTAAVLDEAFFKGHSVKSRWRIR